MGNTSTETIINVKITKSSAEALIKTLGQAKEVASTMTDPINVKTTALLAEVITDVQAGLNAAAKAAGEKVGVKDTVTVTTTSSAASCNEPPKYG